MKDYPIKPGYAGKDAMREKAEKAIGSEGNKLDEHNRFKKVRANYAKGGAVKGCMKMAAGGVAKIRHMEATASGKPIMLKKDKKMMKMTKGS